MLEKYIHGPRTDWGGYCEYDRRRELYRYILADNPITGWCELTAEDLASYLDVGAWAHAIPVGQQLPEGF